MIYTFRYIAFLILIPGFVMGYTLLAFDKRPPANRNWLMAIFRICFSHSRQYFLYKQYCLAKKFIQPILFWLRIKIIKNKPPRRAIKVINVDECLFLLFLGVAW